MKRIIITLASFVLFGTAVNAQTKTKNGKTKATKQAVKEEVKVAIPTPAPVAAPAQTPTPQAGAPMQAAPAPQAEVYDFDKYAKVDKMEHNFGENIKQTPEGVTCTFTVTNTSNEPVTIENVQASCGCTVPTWDKAPIAPGKTGQFQANYHAQGRPGPFTKTLTIRTNRGNKAVTIKGSVEPSPVVETPPTGAPAPANNMGH